jgi:hypothetical protein
MTQTVTPSPAASRIHRRLLPACSTTIEDINRLHQGTLAATGSTPRSAPTSCAHGCPWMRAPCSLYGWPARRASVALSETMERLAAIMTLQDDEQAVGLEINANHLRAARSGW